MWHPLQLECPECGNSVTVIEVLVCLPLSIRLQGECTPCDGDVICDLNIEQLTLLAQTGEANQRVLQQYESELAAPPEQDGA